MTTNTCVSALAIAALLVAGCGGTHSVGVDGGPAGTTGTIDPGCGTVSEPGSCVGNTLSYCGTGDLPDGGTAVFTGDCSTALSGVTLTCGVVDASYGNDCVVPTGDGCVFRDASSGGIVIPLCAGGPGAACVLGPTGSACATGRTACTPQPDGGATLTCVGNLLEIGCQVDQPVGYDCQAFGGGCFNAQCQNLPAGAPCDPASVADPLFLCATGHACQAVPDGGSDTYCG